jgi:hypothetical protein
MSENTATGPIGPWWEVPWWAEEVYSKESGWSPSQIALAFANLRDVFSDKWSREVGPHPMLPELFNARGLSPFTFLFKLGDDLGILLQKNLLGDLPRRLRSADEFDGARAELRALAQWTTAGLKIERNVLAGNGNRNCDWKVSEADTTIYGEVKCIEPAQANKRPDVIDPFPWEREPMSFDLAAEGDKAMNVVEENADQIPAQGPGVFMIFGRGAAAALPFSAAAGNRIVVRFKSAKAALRHIAGILVIKTFLYPEQGLVQHTIFVKNPCGVDLSLDLLKTGIPDLILWEGSKT